MQWNQLYWNSSVFTNAEFESLIIMSMSNPENISYSGVIITAIVQFASDMTLQSYLDTWNLLTNDDTELLEWKITDTNVESK